MWLLAFTSWLRIPLSRHGPSINNIFVCGIFPKIVPESSQSRTQPDIKSGPEIWQIVKIQTVQKPDVLLLDAELLKTEN